MKNKYVIIGLGAVLTASIVLYLVKKKEKSSNLSERVKPDNNSVREEIPMNYQETAETPLMKEVQEEKPAEKTEEPITVEAEEKETRSVIKAAPGSRRIGQYDDDMNLIAEYDSATLAAKAVGSNRTSIRDCANGKQKHAGGFIWR
ncbi:MAG: hypothetical protein J5949_00540, partial [Oscillospiraceae bacterium]|nr:hypothetical protein [Oscillospiraceae bacterium]